MIFSSFHLFLKLTIGFSMFEHDQNITSQHIFFALCFSFSTSVDYCVRIGSTKFSYKYKTKQTENNMKVESPSKMNFLNWIEWFDILWLCAMFRTIHNTFSLVLSCYILFRLCGRHRRHRLLPLDENDFLWNLFQCNFSPKKHLSPPKIQVDFNDSREANESNLEIV